MSKQITVQLLPVAAIATPSYVRTQNGHDKEGLKQLAASINQHGLLQPVVVRAKAEADDFGSEIQWVIVAGRRRVAACKMAGLTEVPALVANTDETRSYEMEIAENLQREDMTLADTARAVRTLMTIYDSAKKVAEVLNKSPAWVSKHLAITSSKCPATVVDLMDRALVSDLETLMLLKQIAETPASNPAAMPTLTRMLRIANEGNMNRQIARDALAKLRAPAGTPEQAPGVTTKTIKRTLPPTTNESENDPKKTFTLELPIACLDKLIAAASRDGVPPEQWLIVVIGWGEDGQIRV